MQRREIFLKDTSDALCAYQEATEIIRQLLRDDRAEGIEWLEAIVRQQQALDEWSSLPRRYCHVDVED